MRALLDTNILVRHLTGEPPAQARRATAFLAGDDDLILSDLITAELVYVLESYYGRPRNEVARAVRALLALPSVDSDQALLPRAIDLYAAERHDFVDPYPCAIGATMVVATDHAFARRI